MIFNEKQRGIGGLAIFIIIAIVSLLAGTTVYLIGRNSSNTARQTNPMTTGFSEISPNTPKPTSTVSGDTSDTGLAKDSAEVDSQLKAADLDSANVNTGLNDQQGNLSEQ